MFTISANILRSISIALSIITELREGPVPPNPAQEQNNAPPRPNRVQLVGTVSKVSVYCEQPRQFAWYLGTSYYVHTFDTILLFAIYVSMVPLSYIYSRYPVASALYISM
eukprot:6213754-Pleurochrysis_carterae.AAC.1